MSHFTETKQMPLWAQCIGGLIINFGGTEFLTFVWIRKLAGNDAARKANKDTLSERIETVIKLVTTSELLALDKEKAVGLWNEVKGLSQIRNRIAHNPINIGSQPETGEPVLTIFDLKNAIPGIATPIDALGIPKIKETALRVREINLELDALIKTVPLNQSKIA